jgi:flagellin FlaB
MRKGSPVDRLDTDRGQIGVETVIIFVAMILVAVVATGVLINTAGFLLNKESLTGEDSQKRASNQVIITDRVMSAYPRL